MKKKRLKNNKKKEKKKERGNKKKKVRILPRLNATFQRVKRLSQREVNVDFERRFSRTIVPTCLVKGFKKYQNEDDMSEAAHLRMFISTLKELLMTNSSISLHDGETVSLATQRMKIMNGDDEDYGRRIDLIVRGRQEKQQEELCSNEFKKSGVQVHQQSKNMRINACIINEWNLLLSSTETAVNYFDFCGRKAYISQLYNFDSCLVSFNTGSFTIPKNLVQLDQFKDSLINLYNWKKSTVDNSNMARTILEEENEKCGIIDISQDTIGRCYSPPRNAIPKIKVVFSPSKGKKRNRDAVFQEEI